MTTPRLRQLRIAKAATTETVARLKKLTALKGYDQAALAHEHAALKQSRRLLNDLAKRQRAVEAELTRDRVAIERSRELLNKLNESHFPKDGVAELDQREKNDVAGRKYRRIERRRKP